ncbi:MAG: hypothetical protein UX71_C0007G0011 [Parcubacteria group bacterium GW2011_GWA1_47_10]|uniref:Fimbrial assembly family protein n=1 Tax=Candidatus Nomurabacteria bacterium GW2011_GWB1_47_6 TaxID=1618749 RepID=A0A0G1VZA9_9BACT|nr:MAG: hypothetical protein UX71_C0007G0011 [Parcubacteria group bacterium GW2011_GWA1_47_10]KKU75420.1 MAG: hypothetical protein UY01_C0013G0010 [Candidatus Nomurabacteria bacterium GW2011_GWB1_47_6]
MDQNFQTSFIPKKPIIKERAVSSRPVGPLVIISLFILFTVLVATGGLYFYKKLTAKNIESMKENLKLAQNRFEPSKITELQTLDKRLRAGNEILSAHVAVTPIFAELGKITMKTVRFLAFSYTRGEERNAPVKVEMKGQAVGYRSVALQSDLFTKNKNFIDPIFSNLTLDPAGNVLFDLDFSIDPTFLDYKQTIVQSDQQNIE